MNFCKWVAIQKIEEIIKNTNIAQITNGLEIVESHNDEHLKGTRRVEDVARLYWT